MHLSRLLVWTSQVKIFGVESLTDIAICSERSFLCHQKRGKINISLSISCCQWYYHRAQSNNLVCLCTNDNNIDIAGLSFV